MTTSKQSSASCTGGDLKNWSLHELKDEAELEDRDRRTGHDYVPMDLYVDPRERSQHFAASKVLKRLRRTH
jgi:hypothetical protein